MNIDETTFLRIVKKDAAQSELIRKFLSVKVAVDKDKAQLVEGSLGNDVLTLFEGMKVSGVVADRVAGVARTALGVQIQYMSLLSDPSMRVEMDSTQNGFILTSPPDVARTKAIKRWATPVTYGRDPRGAGFASAIKSITEFSVAHIQTHRMYSQLLDIDYTRTPLLERISNANDWQGVWRIYNKLAFGHGAKSDMAKRIREDARALGLADREMFQVLIHKSKMPFSGLAALDTIQLGIRRDQR